MRRRRRRRTAEMIEAYCAYQRQRNFTDATVKRRRLTLTTFARFLLPATLDAADLDDVEQFLATKPTARTRHAYLSDLRTFYRWAARRGLLEQNPCDQVDPIRLPKTLPKPIGDEVHGALLTGRARTRLMVAFGLFAGLRAAEIAGLDAADLALNQVPPVLVVREGKGRKDRIIPVHPILAAMCDGLPSGPVFPNGHGKPITASACGRTIREHLHRCGIDATAHQLRHTFGTELARQLGGNLLAVARLMGHSSTETTKGYTAWVADAADEVARMFTGDAA